MITLFCYYLILAILGCIYAGSRGSYAIAYTFVLWPLYAVMGVLFLCVVMGIYLITLFFGLFYKFGEMFK